jgi:hypothetical protein
MRQQTINTAVLAVSLAVLALGTGSLFGDEHDKKTDVTITEAVQVPGGTVLPPGTYMFILNNSANNRNIVEIRSDDGTQLYAMAFTTRATRVQRGGNTVLTFYEMPAGQPPALRQWLWPGDYDGQEFLYPSSEAAGIDQVSNQRVPEVSDQDYSNLVDRGFSTRYPASLSEASGQSSTPILNANDQPSSPGRTLAPPDRTGAHIVGDPGPKGRDSQDLPASQ